MKFYRTDRRKLWLSTLVVTASFAGVYGSALLFENTVSSSLAVNYSKRIAAESAAVFLRVYDPFAAYYKRADLGPEGNRRGVEAGMLTSKKEIDGFLGENPELSQNITLLSFSNSENGRSVFPFSYQPFGEDKLEQLQVSYDLHKTVEKGHDELDKMVLLRDWVHQQWMIGTPSDVNFNFNALDILERGQRG